MSERYYLHPLGHRVPSVTTITSQLDKSSALIQWAVNCACDYLIYNLNNNESLWQYPFEAGIDEENGACYIKKSHLFPLIEKARKEYKKISQKALDIGSEVHKAIEEWLKTGKEPFNPSDQVLSAFLAFLEWLDQWKSYKTIETEFTIYDPNGKYAGTCDWIVELDGRVYLIDFKSSSGIYPEYRYQVAAYRACDPDIEACGVLRLNKETGYPQWKDTSDTYEQDLKVFNCLCDLWWARHPDFK